MPMPINDIQTLINTSGCYSGQTLGLARRRAINVANLAAQLGSSGGTNYVGNLNQLLIDSACWSTLQPDEFEQVKSQIIANNATSGGATVGNIDAQTTAAACILNASLSQLIAAELFLMANIGAGRNPPA